MQFPYFCGLKRVDGICKRMSSFCLIYKSVIYMVNNLKSFLFSLGYICTQTMIAQLKKPLSLFLLYDTIKLLTVTICLCSYLKWNKCQSNVYITIKCTFPIGIKCVSNLIYLLFFHHRNA